MESRHATTLASSDLYQDLNWRFDFIPYRINQQGSTIVDLLLPGNESVCGRFIQEKRFKKEERIVLLLALAPYIIALNNPSNKLENKAYS
ncbi:MAG: hypothetical protein MUF42_13325 [Cytophagaceae bacterium]|nr:hypothetical protein [Cytophagaceae bacterium]